MRRSHLPALLPLVLLGACATAATPAPPTDVGGAAMPEAARAVDSPSERLARLFADEWEWQLRTSPMLATSVGDARYDDRLAEVGLEAQARELEENRAFLRRLEAIPRDALSPAERVNYEVFRRIKEDEVAEAELRGYLIPITNREGFHTFFPELPANVPLRTVEDYENYVARLRDFRRYAAEHVELMHEGMAAGVVLPAVSVAGVPATLRPHVVDDPEESLLWAPFEEFPETVPETERERLRAAGRTAIRESVVPGYAEFLRFVEEEYAPAARPTVGLSELPGGREWYAQRVRHYTTLDVTPEEVHRTGLAEVARIRAEMDEVIRSTGFRGGFADFVRMLRTDPRFYAETPEELLQTTALVLKRMDGELPRLFGRLPRMPYGIKEIPDYLAPLTTTAYYQPPAGDGTRGGVYWVNTYDLSSRPLYEVQALSLHEAVPGHHLQLALQQEMEELPEFRRFGGFTAFVEGWALYAESLGAEAGFYDDPYSEFGRLTYEAWRACRLVVDTGIHAFGWDRQRAIDFMAANTGLSLLNIENEVDRYIAWPGQALAYKTGQMEIRSLRDRAERELGADFDVRAFHDVVLGSGSVPLTVLRENVRGWIAGVKAGR